MLKFIYSEKAVCTVDKSKVKILQNFVAFSEYMNFIIVWKVEFIFFLFGRNVSLKELFRFCPTFKHVEIILQ